jgi:hypothetical protein
VQYYCNYGLYQRDHPGLKIALFTHLEKSGPYRQRFLDVAELCDAGVYMNRKVEALVRRLQGGRKPGRVIYPGSDLALNRPVVFGVAGRTYTSGRKGEHLVGQMVDAGYFVVALGKGWPCESVQLERVEFYASIDYLVVTSINEGGPVPILDAIACGVPVIAPDVGFCWEFPVIRYEAGSFDSLNAVLGSLAQPRTWEDWRQDHAALFAELGQKVA